MTNTDTAPTAPKVWPEAAPEFTAAEMADALGEYLDHLDEARRRARSAITALQAARRVGTRHHIGGADRLGGIADELRELARTIDLLS